MHLNYIWSCDVIDDQFLGRLYAIFPGLHAVRSCDTLVMEGSHDKPCDGLCDRFPQSYVLGVTWL